MKAFRTSMAIFAAFSMVSAGTVSAQTTWTMRTSNTGKALHAAVWTGTKIVVVGADRTTLSSPDGVVWSGGNAEASDALNALAWTGSRLVAVGTNVVRTSTDGRSWTPQTLPKSYNLRSVAWSGSKFVAVGGQGYMGTSPDGVAWTEEVILEGQVLNGVIKAGNQLVAVGSTGNILTSPIEEVTGISRRDGKALNAGAPTAVGLLNGADFLGRRHGNRF